jgi:small basic protein
MIAMIDFVIKKKVYHPFHPYMPINTISCADRLMGATRVANSAALCNTVPGDLNLSRVLCCTR